MLLYLYTVQCTIRSTLYNVQCTVRPTPYNIQYDLHRTMYIVRCMVYGVYCMVYGVMCIMFDVRCILFTPYDVGCTPYTMYDVQWCTIWCIVVLFAILCTIYTICSTHRSQIWVTKYSALNVRHIMNDVHFINTFCGVRRTGYQEQYTTYTYDVKSIYSLLYDVQ